LIACLIVYICLLLQSLIITDTKSQFVPVHNQQLTCSAVLGGLHQLLGPFTAAGQFPGV